jgi:hypothetical protein
MKKLTSAVVLTGLFAVGFSGDVFSARMLETHAVPQNQIQSRLTDRQIQVILTRIRTNAEALLTSIEGTRPRGSIFGSRTRQAGDVAYLVDDLVQATVHLSDHVTRRETTRTDVDDLLGRAEVVDTALTRTPGPAAAQSAWSSIRRDVESLAAAYSIAWDWQNPQYPGIPGSGIYQRLTGTYQLDTARSDNPQRVIDTALRTVPAANRARVARQITRRLDPPDLLAIDRNGQQVTIGSEFGDQVKFEADGRARTESTPGGVALNTRATLYGDRLEITTTGGAANLDYAVTFEPLAAGRDLQVTHRIYNDALTQPVNLRTVYRRTSEVPDWTLGDRGRSTVAEPSGMLVPDGVTVEARLDQTINLRTARDDDRVTLVVHNAPRAELEGATIEGYVRRTNDDRGVVFQFDQIRLRNGRYSEFDGVIERMIGPNGETVPFDGEQATVGDRNQTQESIERGAIGAAVGAILGAIVGGSKGAAIGAVVGGGGAVATVLLGQNQSQLLRGTDFTIRSRAR